MQRSNQSISNRIKTNRDKIMLLSIDRSGWDMRKKKTENSVTNTVGNRVKIEIQGGIIHIKISIIFLFPILFSVSIIT